MRDPGPPGQRAVGVQLKGQSSRTGCYAYPKRIRCSLEFMPCGGQRGRGQTGENTVDFKVIKEKAGKSMKPGE